MGDKKAIGVFLVLTFALSAVCYALLIAGGAAATGVTALLMWCPGASAFIVQAVVYKRKNVTGIHRFDILFAVAAFLLPVIYLGVSYSVYWSITPGGFSWQLGAMTAPVFITMLLSSFLTAAGEEIGWRGFLLPKMEGVWGLNAAVALSGLIWAVWHYPPMLAGLYQAGTPIWFQLPMFTITTIAMAAILAVLRLQSKSVWPAAILHASHNFFDQVIFSSLTKGENSAYFAGETGCITAVVLIAIAATLLVRYNKRAQSQGEGQDANRNSIR